MPTPFSSFSRRGPDIITEELVAALSGKKSYEFKALFLVIHAELQARNAASGGEEMLRLRTYDKLQTLVRQGQVTKKGKEYKGERKGLLLLAETMKAEREKNPRLQNTTAARSKKPASAEAGEKVVRPKRQPVADSKE